MRAAALGVAAMLAAVVLAPAAHAATVGTFQALANSPTAMTGVTVDPTTNLVYAQAFGGTAWYRYNPSTNTWTTLAPDPISDSNDAGAAYLNGKIYLSFPSNSGLAVYTIATNTWTTISTNPTGGETGAITSAGGLLYLGIGSTFVSYDPTTGHTTTLANIPAFTGATGEFCGGSTDFQAWGTLAVLDGKIYAAQGNSCNGFAVYDIATNTWQLLHYAPNGLVMGGAIDPVSRTFFGYGDYGQSIWDIYDIATNTWTTKTWPGGTLDDGGMAYVSAPGLQGIYAVEGEDGPAFERYVTPAPTADVSVKKTASKAKVVKGKGLTYTLSVHNAGPQASNSTTVTDKLPSSMKFVSSSASQGSCSGTTTVTCDLGTLASGASATVKIKVKTTRTGKFANHATVSTADTDSNTANNTSKVTVRVVSATKPLRLAVTPNHAQAGTSTCFRFTARSSGHGVRGVTVTLAGHHARTSSSGRATLCLALSKGTHTARATKHGYRTATAAVRITAAPAFTG